MAHKPYGLSAGKAKKMWRRGERLPPAAYIGPKYFITEPRIYHLAPSRPGHRWIVIDGDAYLIEVATGMVAETVFGAVAENYGPPPPRSLWLRPKNGGAHVTLARTRSRRTPFIRTATRAWIQPALSGAR